MTSTKINVKGGKLFPLQFQLLAFILLFLGTALLFVNLPVAIIMLLVSGLLLTGYSGCEFDLGNKSYREYNSFFMFRFGKWKNTKAVDKIYVNKIKTSQKIYSRANLSTTVKAFTYKCFVKFSDGEKILLLENKDKSYVFEIMLPMAKSFEKEIEDNS